EAAAQGSTEAGERCPEEIEPRRRGAQRHGGVCSLQATVLVFIGIIRYAQNDSSNLSQRVRNSVVKSSSANPLLGTIFENSPHRHFARIDSTNKQAMTAAANGSPEGSVFTADEQTAGRGRSDHSWHSPAGQGLYVSIVLRPQLAPNDVLWLSL